MNLTLIPILSDNYSYLVEGNGDIGIVDPGEAAPILSVLQARGLRPNFVLITHYHGDHVAGLDDVSDAYPDARVIGKNHEDLSAFDFGGERVDVIQTPGHKRDHVCFHFPDSAVLFSGDVLFAMGCGRLLDGTTEEMFGSLQKLSALPDETQVYCGHEYTLSNAEFCLAQAPDNDAIQKRYDAVKELRNVGKPTIPFTLKEEKETNLFLQAKSAAEFAALRHLKDNF